MTVRYFAAAKAATGIETETLQLSEGVTVRDLVNSIGTRGADVAKVLSRCSFLRDGVAVAFTYQAPDAAPTTRTVDPVKVHRAGGQWYLQGWCHLRQAMRTFHLDRVSDVRLTDIVSTHGDDSVPGLFEGAARDVEVVVRYRASAAPLLADYVVIDDPADAGAAVRSARVRVGDARSLKRVAAKLGGDLEIVGPDAARHAAAAWAEAGLAQYA